MLIGQNNRKKNKTTYPVDLQARDKRLNRIITGKEAAASSEVIITGAS